jgi:hypothetical protein
MKSQNGNSKVQLVPEMKSETQEGMWMLVMKY